MLLIDFNLKHGVGKGFDDFAFYFDLVLFWHTFLSLSANTLFPLICLNNYDNCKGDKMAAVVTAATNYEL